MLSSFLKNLTRRFNNLGAATLSCPFLEMFYSYPLSRTELKTPNFQQLRCKQLENVLWKLLKRLESKRGISCILIIQRSKKAITRDMCMIFSPQTKIMIILPLKALTGRELQMDVLENRQTKARQFHLSKLPWHQWLRTAKRRIHSMIVKNLWNKIP